MATATNFDFTGGAIDVGPNGTFVDNGVTFTFSYSNSGSGTSGYFPARTSSGNGGDTGQLTMVETHVASAADAAMFLAISSTNGFSKFTGTFQIKAFSVVGNWQLSHKTLPIGSFSPGNSTLTVTAAKSGGTALRFTNSSAPGSRDFLFIGEIVGTINCFAAGTEIATPQGPVAVENLRPGDRLLTADGGTTTMKWLGEQPVNVRLSHPAKVNPICIRAGALAEGVPARDLFLSADHAIAIDGLLINAGALVNGRTITQIRDMPLDGFTYYHIETEGGHELLLAEGVAAESFIDYADTDSFVNAHERTTTAPIPEMNLPRISAARLVPQAIRDRLAGRSAIARAA